MGSLCCAHPPARPAAPAQAEAQGPDTSSEQRAHEQQVHFVAAATRALMQVYDEDSDDSSLLSALMHQLSTLPRPSFDCDGWRELLDQGLTRARQLARMAPQLRALRRAHAQASIDQLSGTLSGVDRPMCLRALAELAQDLASTPAFVVTVEPWGPITLAGLRRLCRARTPVSAPEPVAAPSQSLLWPAHG